MKTGSLIRSVCAEIRPIRVYLDGCFDMMHYGHANALRQAKGVGDELIVGLVPDDEVEKYKGCKPVLTEDERLILLKAIKWVDEVQIGLIVFHCFFEFCIVEEFHMN